MADTSTIYQDVIEGAADDATTTISQNVLEAGADDAGTAISQAILEGAADDAGTEIYQVVIEWSAGPLVPPPAAVRTFRFDAGIRSHYWLALQPSDSGDELRSKQVKAGRWTAKVTNASFLIYKWDVGEPINMADVEQGTNAATRPQRLADVAHVTQSARKQVNVPNACLHLMRVQGTWEGDVIKDRLDEGVYEVSRQGVRR